MLNAENAPLFGYTTMHLPCRHIAARFPRPLMTRSHCVANVATSPDLSLAVRIFVDNRIKSAAPRAKQIPKAGNGPKGRLRCLNTKHPASH